MLYGVFSAGDGHLVKIFKVPSHICVFVHYSLVGASTMMCPCGITEGLRCAFYKCCLMLRCGWHYAAALHSNCFGLWTLQYTIVTTEGTSPVTILLAT